MTDETKKKPHIPKWLNFIIGGTSGGLSITIVQPMDLLKTRMQLLGLTGKKTSTVKVIRGIIAHEGFRGFYVGISAAWFRQATYGTGRLGTFNSLMDTYKHMYNGPPGFGTKIGIGMLSGGVGGLVGTPADNVLIRMTADGRLPVGKRRNYKHIFNALGRIIREEGVRTLWRGAGATVTRAMVVNGAQLSSYAQAREFLLPSLGEGILLHFCSALITGPITTFASLPVDIVKTRIQQSSNGAIHISVLRGIIKVIKKEGVLALWSGFLPNYAKTGPNIVLTFIFLEQFKGLYYKMAVNSNN